MADVTRILDALRDGETGAADRLLEILYDELRRLAAAQMRREAPGRTLQATALVHEAWMRLAAGEGPSFENRAHFFGAAAEAMRRILVENARRRLRAKRGGGRARVPLSAVEPVAASAPFDLLDLDAALDRFAAEEPEKAELVKLRHFAGLGQEEAAGILGISRGTADRWWAFARAWLFDALKDGTRDGEIP